MKKSLKFLLLPLACVILAGCSTAKDDDDDHDDEKTSTVARTSSAAAGANGTTPTGSLDASAGGSTKKSR